MAKKIIILENNPSDGGTNTIKALFWFAIAANRRIPRPEVVNTGSLWSGASQAEVQQLATGEVLEDLQLVRVPASSPLATIKSTLISTYNDREIHLASLPFKLQYTGTYWDGTSWT